DTYPPRLEVVSLSHYIKIGGSCLTVYNASNDAKRSGVKVGDHFFKGYLTNFPGIYVAYFALPWDATTSTPITLEAQDRAGNINKLSFPHKILRKKFRSDRITVTDSFLNRKMPEFSEGCERLSGEPLEIYLKVNRELRQKTEQRIENMCQKASTDKKLWKGPFLRMKGSPKSLFGDKRSYYYKGKEIDKQIHLGIDIAALEHFPVGAANNGIVIFSNYLGIYGNSIIIDHGQGLCSLYGHLSTTKIESGNEVKKGDIIGYTGSTGLAGGDHLHFSILVDGMYVNPVEWWDPHWVEDNITEKLR
ncbi:MAG: M23 family metallopeptidase, partial [Thermodesulfobacteriota bacterium]|nr:M23 family metallopeptidase [Thermodesulfobacteriota bacterium]